MSEYRGKYDATDVMGTRIKVGDTIAYPVRRRSKMVLKTAVVVHVEYVINRSKPPTISYTITALNDRGRRVMLRVPSRIAIVMRKKDETKN